MDTFAKPSADHGYASWATTHSSGGAGLASRQSGSQRQLWRWSVTPPNKPPGSANGHLCHRRHDSGRGLALRSHRLGTALHADKSDPDPAALPRPSSTSHARAPHRGPAQVALPLQGVRTTRPRLPVVGEGAGRGRKRAPH